MAYVWPSHARLVLDNPRELQHAPRTVVRFGDAPDGLPWLLDVDRAQRLDVLFSTVLQVFELTDRADLPDRVRIALENDVAAGLMGVHDVALSSDGGGDTALSTVYTSRRKLKHLLGPTLLAQTLEKTERSAPRELDMGSRAATNVAPMAAREQAIELVEAVERSIRDRQAKRHLLLPLDSPMPYSGSVRNRDRALRIPSPPYRPLVAESLLSLSDVQAKATSAVGEIWRAPLADSESYRTTLNRLQQNDGGHITFEIPRQALLQAMVTVARDVARLHERGLVHGDLAPGNILLAGAGPTSFDSLDIEAGTPATAATFAWAAPEQIVGHPVDPRTDVFSLGRLVTRIVEGVPFGEQTTYIIPIGGRDSRSVELLKAEGVFLDILDTEYDRKWQLAWQSLLGSAIAYDVSKRPADATDFADRLEEILERFPVTGVLECKGVFGEPRLVEYAEGWYFARIVSD